MEINKVVKEQPVVIYHLPEWSDENRAAFKRFAKSDPLGVYGLDVESTAINEELGGAFDPDLKLRLVQFGTKSEAWCLDPHGPWRPYITTMLRSTDRRFVSHTNYDILWTQREFDIDLAAENRSIDTKVMADLVHPGKTKKDLKDLSIRYIDFQLKDAELAMLARFKELAPVNHRVGKKLKAWGFTNIPLDDPFYGEYGGLDAVYVRWLLDYLSEAVKQSKMTRLSRREQRVQRLAIGMQQRGHRVDREWTANVLHEIETEYNNADDRLHDLFGFSPRSPRVGPWLAEHGAEFFELTDCGNPVLNKDTLPIYAVRYENDDVLGPVFKDKLILSERSNLLTNLNHVMSASAHDGFVHPLINTNRGVTGRMSIVRPAMQTFSKTDKRLRGCFLALDGHVFVSADYDSQEIRIAAAYSGDRLLNRIVAEGLNQHVLTAQSIFAERFKGKSESPNEYKAAKILDFAQQYGAGPLKIGDQLGLPRGPWNSERGRFDANPEALDMWKSWRKAYRGLVQWTDRMSHLSTVVNPWGRRIPNPPYKRYANGNYMIQSSGRDVLSDAMLALDERGYANWLWLPLHDELILQVPEDQAELTCRALEECMYAEFERLGGGVVPLTATAEIVGKRWGGGA